MGQGGMPPITGIRRVISPLIRRMIMVRELSRRGIIRHRKEKRQSTPHLNDFSYLYPAKRAVTI